MRNKIFLRLRYGASVDALGADDQRLQQHREWMPDVIGIGRHHVGVRLTLVSLEERRIFFERLGWSTPHDICRGIATFCAQTLDEFTGTAAHDGHLHIRICFGKSIENRGRGCFPVSGVDHQLSRIRNTDD